MSIYTAYLYTKDNRFIAIWKFYCSFDWTARRAVRKQLKTSVVNVTDVTRIVLYAGDWTAVARGEARIVRTYHREPIV